MKTNRLHLLALTAFATLSTTQSLYSTPMRFILSAVGTPSVGALFSSTVNGRTSFHFPDTPHFRRFYDFTAPRKYSALYHTNAGKITLGGFLRFTDQGHKIFSEKAEQKSYKKALSNAISAQKDYKARPSKKRKEYLETKEDHVMHLLNTVALTPSVCSKLEDILSTGPRSKWSFLTRWVFPWRTTVEEDKWGRDPVINRGSLLLEPVKTIARSVVHTTVVLSLALATNATVAWFAPALYLTHPRDALRANVMFVHAGLLTCALGAQLSSLSTYNLAPEPAEGVRVIIQRDPTFSLGNPEALPPAVDIGTEVVAAVAAPGPAQPVVSKTLKVVYQLFNGKNKTKEPAVIT